MVDIYWFFTDLPFLHFPTVFNSKDWCEDPWHYHGLGEVFGAPRPYNGMEHVAGLIGGHICGTPEQFLEGGEWPPTGEPLVYDDDGIPTCCRRIPIFLITSGSRPAAVFRFPPLRSSSSTSSRPAALAEYVPHVVIRLRTGSTIGADVEYRGLYLGRESSGSRPAALVTFNPVHVGNAATGSRPAAEVDFAVVQLGRAAAGSRPAALVRAGAPILGSAKSGSSTNSEMDFGVCHLGAPRCSAATSRMVGLECAFFHSTILAQWFKWNLIPGKEYRFILDLQPDSAGAWTMHEGATCAGLTPIFSGTEHPPHQEIDFTATAETLAWELTGLSFTGMIGTTKVIRLN